MQTHANATQENNSRSAAVSGTQVQSHEASSLEMEDNHAEAPAQLNLQEMANNSPGVSRQGSYQAMANNSPMARQAVQLQAMADSYSVQNKQTVQRAVIYQAADESEAVVYNNLAEMSPEVRALFPTGEYDEKALNALIARHEFKMTSKTTKQEVAAWVRENFGKKELAEADTAKESEVADAENQMKKWAVAIHIPESSPHHSEKERRLTKYAQDKAGFRNEALGKGWTTFVSESILAAVVLAAPYLTPAVPVWWVIVGGLLYFAAKLLQAFFGVRKANLLIDYDPKRAEDDKAAELKQMGQNLAFGTGAAISGLLGSEPAAALSGAAFGMFTFLAAIFLFLPILAAIGDVFTESEPSSGLDFPDEEMGLLAGSKGSAAKKGVVRRSNKVHPEGSASAAVKLGGSAAAKSNIKSKTAGGWFNNGDIIAIDGTNYRVRDYGFRGNNCLMLCILALTDLSRDAQDTLMAQIRARHGLAPGDYIGADQITGFLTDQNFNLVTYQRIGGTVTPAGETGTGSINVHLVNVGGNHWQLMTEI